jgi:hypothetical protein
MVEERCTTIPGSQVNALQDLQNALIDLSVWLRISQKSFMVLMPPHHYACAGVSEVVRTASGCAVKGGNFNKKPGPSQMKMAELGF